MSLPSPYSEVYYAADGVTTSFAFGQNFTALNETDVKCIIYFEDGTNCVPTFEVDTDTGFIYIVTLTKPDGTILTVPPVGSTVRVFRDTPEAQNITASQLQNYTTKQLERIFDSVVAMIQEVSYSDLHKTIRLTETQRDVSVEQLTEEKDQGILYWDFESRTLKATDYGQDEVVKSETVDRLMYIQAEGKIYFIPKGSNNPIPLGVATIHNDLSGRNAPDCHPESAITNLTTHLQELRDADTALAEDVQTALNRSQEAKDTADEAKETAEYAQTVADEAKGIAEDAKETAEGIENIAQEALDKVTQEITDREDADEDLQDQIDSLSGRGRFLALWNCATGLAESNPPESPYTYKAGDYFVVGTVSSAEPAVNYKPNGSSYTTGVASTTVETNEVSVNDTYFYDGTVWKLQKNKTDIKVSDVQINDVSVVEDTIAKITVDATVVDDSANAVAGGAVFDALAEKQDSLPALEAGKFLTNNGTNLSWAVVSSGITYKGQVDTVGDLPEDPAVGDMYYCVADGKNYIWNGTSWDAQTMPPMNETNLVHKSGTETISGAKTFTSPVVIKTNNTYGLDIKSPSSGGYLYVTRGSGGNAVRFAIKAGVNGGTIGTDTNDKFSVRVNNVNKMTFEKNGAIKLAANPASTSNDTQVATTKWVKDRLSTSSIFIYKGTVADLAALTAITNPSIGDVYYVTSETLNYAWNGSSWDSLAGTFTIDDALSDSSVNAVQNKIVTGALAEKAVAVNTPNINTYAVEDGYLQVTPQAAQEGEELEAVNIVSIESDPATLTGNTDTLVASSVAKYTLDKKVSRYNTLPERPASDDGSIVLYTGETTETYVYGSFYKWVASVENGYQTGEFDLSIDDEDLLISQFTNAESTLGLVITKLKFVCTELTEGVIDGFNVYAVDSESTEHTLVEGVDANAILDDFGIEVSAVEGEQFEEGDYFEVDNTSAWVKHNLGVSATYDATTKTITFA